MRPCKPAVLAAAYLADLAIGDPPSFPHPVKAMGWSITRAQALWQPPRGANVDFVAGALLTAALFAGCYRLSKCAEESFVLAVALGWTTLATRSLLDETSAVLDALGNNSLHEARRLLARVVGRDTADLNEAEIARAVIETLAESLCDGVVAPLLYLAAGGVPAAVTYKALNTLDSMVGHTEPPYSHFGRFAARADDGANFLPARITALLISLAAHRHMRRALRTWWRDGDRHSSPNAGQSEAAMAGALGVRLGGINFYDGHPSPKPLLGTQFRPPAQADVGRALQVTARVSALAFCCALLWTLKR